jgi:ABC-2 type transport system ATP-binding protein
MLAAYLPPTSGTASVGGHDVVEHSLDARKSIGYMPETVPLHPEMRVEEYLRFRAEIKGSRARPPPSEDRAMELADVTDVRRRLIGELSKGYKQRVGLADALVASPPLLILDEPTEGLDPNQILRFREVIRASAGSTRSSSPRTSCRRSRRSASGDHHPRGAASPRRGHLDSVRADLQGRPSCARPSPS